MRKLLCIVALVLGLWSGRAIADDYTANAPLHLAVSAGITYGLYALIHYGFGTENKTPAWGFGATGALIAGAMWQMGDGGAVPAHHVQTALEYNAIGAIGAGVCIWSFDL